MTPPRTVYYPPENCILPPPRTVYYPPPRTVYLPLKKIKIMLINTT